ncbi:unnamed protein product [Polarella glacialis]|uniref:Uncharacterized protein n=1 Tax=Polarella glacialis TaxID=89957 RepID=A0A813IUV8_POLGL|nr:unnamed protein product [Polarella glacialis]
MQSVARLLVGGADVNQATLSGSTALHVASQGGHTEAVAWLLAGKAEVDKEMQGGTTPLYLAARRGHSEVIAWLLAKHANVDCSTDSGSCPLYAAARGGHAEAVGRLLAAGAAANGKVGQVLGGYCSFSSTPRSPLRVAVVGCHTDAIGRLIGGGAEVKPEDVWTSLVLGNVRGARRLAKATGYSWALWQSGLWLCTGALAACASTWILCVGLVRRGFAELQTDLTPDH